MAKKTINEIKSAGTEKIHKHEWGKTERTFPGGKFLFHACKICKQLRAYDMVKREKQ